jgi:hypothetical protein
MSCVENSLENVGIRENGEGPKPVWLTRFIVSGVRPKHRLDIPQEQMSTFRKQVKEWGKTIAQPSVSRLSESTMNELRTALTEQLKQPDGPTPEIADILKKISREARQNNIPPEELIVIFKELWNSLADSLRPQNADQYERVRQRLVTLCIQAYYAE